MKAAIFLSILSPVILACGNSGRSTPPDLASSVPAPTRETEIGDPLEPIARVEGSTFIEILEVRTATNGRLFYCTGVRGLQVVDARDPANMKVVAELRSSKFSHQRFARCQHVAIEGDRVYFTNRGDMIQKTPFITGYDLSKSPPAEVINYAAKDATIEGIAAVGGKLYVAMHDRGLAVMQPSGDTLTELGVASGFRAAWSVAVSGKYAYVADAGGSMGVVDISDSTKPKRVASLETGGSAQSIVVANGLAYLAAGAAGLLIVDIGDPLAPSIVSRTKTNGSALQVTVDGSRAYVANWADARIYDVRDPKTPTLIAAEIVKTEEAASRVLGMSGVGDVAFVGEWTGMYSFRLNSQQRAPHITSRLKRLDFDRTAAKEASKRSISFRNEGSAPLTVSSVSVSGDGFIVAKQLPVTVASQDSFSIEVSFAPTSSEQHEGELLIVSNDPDESEVRISLVGNQSGLGVGDPAPEINLTLVDGGQWRLSEQRGKVVVLAYFATF